jgi:hypothetical protein
MRRPRLPGAVAEAEARALQAAEDPRSPPARPVAAKFIGQALTPTADTNEVEHSQTDADQPQGNLQVSYHAGHSGHVLQARGRRFETCCAHFVAPDLR